MISFWKLALISFLFSKVGLLTETRLGGRLEIQLIRISLLISISRNTY
jgi:hypothetical protein